jgi:hypothetical protein
VLWSRYNGPGGNVWRIKEEHSSNVWRRASSSDNRLECEKALVFYRDVDAKTADDVKKIGRTLGSTDYVAEGYAPVKRAGRAEEDKQ